MQRSQVYQEGAVYIRGSFPPYNIIIAQSQAIFNLQLLDTHPHHDQPQDHPNPAGPRGRAYRGAGIWELGPGKELQKREKTASLSNNNTLPLSIYIIPHLTPISQVFFYTIILTFWDTKKGRIFSHRLCELFSHFVPRPELPIRQFGAKAEVAYSATS